MEKETLLLAARQDGCCDTVLARIVDDALDTDTVLRTFAIIRMQHPDTLLDPIAAALWSVALLHLASRPNNAAMVHPPVWLPMLALRTPAPHALDDLTSSLRFARTWQAWRRYPAKLSDAIFLLHESAFMHASPAARRTLLDLARTDPHAAKNVGYCLDCMDDSMRSAVAKDQQAALMATYLMGHHPLWFNAVVRSPKDAAEYALALERSRFATLPAHEQRVLETHILASPQAIVQAAEVIGFRRDALNAVMQTGDREAIVAYVTKAAMSRDDWDALSEQERRMTLDAIMSDPSAIRRFSPILNDDPSFWRAIAMHPHRSAEAIAGLGRHGWRQADANDQRQVIESAASDPDAAAALACVAGHHPSLFVAASASPRTLAAYVEAINDEWTLMPPSAQLQTIRTLAKDPDALERAFPTVRAHPAAWRLAPTSTIAAWALKSSWSSLSAVEKEAVVRRLSSAHDLSQETLIAIAPFVGFFPALWRRAMNFGADVAIQYASYAMCADADPELTPSMRASVVDALAPPLELAGAAGGGMHRAPRPRSFA